MVTWKLNFKLKKIYINKITTFKKKTRNVVVD